MVQIFDDGQLIATHPFQASGKRTAIAHYPPERIAFHMRTPTWCRQRATEFGQACVAVIGELLAVNALLAAGRSGRAGPGQQVRRGSARTGLRQGDRRGGSDLPHDQGRPRRRAGSRPRPAPAGDGGAAAFLHGPSRLFENVVAMPTPNTATTSDDHGGSDEPGAGVSA
jgi:hypothetical protein